MSDPETWRAILAEALEEALKKRPDEPVRGTTLKQSLVHSAAKQNLSFPPSEEPGLRLGEFLERHRDLVLVNRRVGQDLLVAPAGQPQLLVAASEEERVSGTKRRRAPGIRSDLFKAFTLVQPNRIAWYDRNINEIVWTPADAPPPGDAAVAIPPPTLEDALRVRRAFAERLDPDARAALESAFTSQRPLAEFSNRVRERHLQLQWHKFRTRDLLQTITEWSHGQQLPWVDDWLVTSDAEAPATLDGVPWRYALSALVESLDAADIRRIAVPLDVVLRILQRR